MRVSVFRSSCNGSAVQHLAGAEAMTQSTRQKDSQGDSSSYYSCSVCLETDMDDPVVTACGHLYCWTCLFKWLDSGQSRCPICSTNVERTEVTPLYVGRLESTAPNSADRSLSCSNTASSKYDLDIPCHSLFGLKLRHLFQSDGATDDILLRA